MSLRNCKDVSIFLTVTILIIFQVELTPTKQKCSRGLYVQTAEDIEHYVDMEVLAQHVMRAKDLAGCVLTLVLFGVKDYFKLVVKIYIVIPHSFTHSLILRSLKPKINVLKFSIFTLLIVM